jgi:anthranilate synthase component 1
MNIQFKTNYIKTLSDTHTPVELYLKIRDKFPHSFLLESSDYKSKENSYSYLCLQPIASFVVNLDETEITLPNHHQKLKTVNISIPDELYAFSKRFKADDLPFDFVSNGLFGYTSYDAIPLFEDIEFSNQDFPLPLIQYHVFKYLIVFNHFNNELYIIEHLLEGERSAIEELNDIVQRRAVNQFKFYQTEKETSNFTDEAFLNGIKKGIEHCYLGDVFQVVLSRKFKTGFKGDEFNVYRALRSINPSPYLFYFDYGNFKIFGSSPEAQLTIAQQKATINPIAGTFKRTGNVKDDEQLAIQLSNDPKENAEHIMLVDLARNDLSRNSKKVQVESFKQVEYYSHVIHLVSKVSAELEEDYNPVKILGDTYPAGTLSGAPKHRAMQIIDENEPNSRGHYGGAVGYMGLNGEFNHAIFIRSFLSFQNELHYQAGCGIVAKSNPESELNEVNNKLSALRKAIELAKTI